MPAISPLRPVGLQLPRFQMAEAPTYQPLRTAPIPEFSRELLAIPTGAERMTAGLGQALEVLRDASVQAGLRNVLAGKPFDAPASDGLGDRTGATLRHAFDSTLGKHAAGVQPSPFDRATELRDPITGRTTASLPAAGNVLAGPDGRLNYEPNRALGMAQAGLSLQNASTNAQLGQLQLTEAQRAAKEREALLGQPPRVFRMGPDGTVVPHVDRPAGQGPRPEPPMAPAGGAIGRVTDYGQKDDPFKDSASLGTGKFTRPTGAWNNPLSPTSLAISPDIEAQFKAAGIKQGDAVRLKLADGSEVVRTWDDRTAQDADVAAGRIPGVTQPLRGRFDFYNPGGPDPRRGQAVVSFAPASAGGVSEFDRPAPGIAADAPAAGQPVVKAERGGPRMFTPLTDQPFSPDGSAFGSSQLSLANTATAPSGPLTSPLASAAPAITPAAIVSAGSPLVADAAPGVPAAAARPPGGPAPSPAASPEGLGTQPNQVQVFGRVIQGRFVNNAELKALGLPAGRDVLQRPKFYRQDIGNGQVATFQTDPDGNKDQMVAGSAKPAIQATAEDQLVAKGLDPGLAPDVLREINLRKGTNPALKIKELIGTMAQYRDAGRNPLEAIAAIKYGTNFKQGDPFHDAARRAMTLNPKAWAAGKDEVFDEIAANLAAGSPEDARSVVEGVVRGSLKDETAKKFAGTETILSKVNELKRVYAQLAATNPAFRDNADPLGNNIGALSQWLAGKAGYLKDPAEATLAASAQNLLNDILREQAGQAVTANELKRYAAVLPGITDSTQLAGLKLGQIEQFQSAVRADVIRRQIGESNFRAIYGGAAPVPAPAVAGQAAGAKAASSADRSSPKMVRTVEEYNALKSGEPYIDPKGNPRTKP